jgi:hypothetical protein
MHVIYFHFCFVSSLHRVPRTLAQAAILLILIREAVMSQSEHLLFNPFPLLFKALLHGQKDRVFFSGHLIYILNQERFRAFTPAGDI